jgi:hypothetical protein
MTQVLSLLLFFALGISAVASAPAAFAMVITMYPMKQLLQAAGGAFLEKSWLTNILTAAVVGVSVARLTATGPGLIRGHFTVPMVGAIVLYLWSALSIAWSPSAEGAWLWIGKGYPYFLLVVLVSPVLATDIRSLERFARTTIYAGTAIAAIMLSSQEFRSISGRLVTNIGPSEQSNPLVIGELGGMLVISSVLVSSAGRFSFLTLVRIAAFVMGTILALESGSRGQIIFSLAIAGLFFPVAHRVRSIGSFIGGTLVLGVAALIVITLALSVVTGYGLTRWDPSSLEGSAAGRIGNVIDLLGAFAARPAAWVAGLGYNAFSSISSNALDGYAHNLSAEILAELGIPMFVVYVVSVVSAARSGARLLVRHKDAPDQRAAVGLFLALFAFELLLVQKQGTLWIDCTLFMIMSSIARVDARERLDIAVDGSADDGVA